MLQEGNLWVTGSVIRFSFGYRFADPDAANR
jgi:hypothetical protein